MLLAQQRENDRLQDRIRVLEESVSEYKQWLGDALAALSDARDEIARLKAEPRG